LLFFICASLAVIPTLWMRRSYNRNPTLAFDPWSPQQQQQRQLMHYRAGQYNTWQVTDPRTVDLKDDATPIPQSPKDDATPQSIMTPLHVCERKAPIPHDEDMEIMQNHASHCPLSNEPPEKTTLLLLDGLQTFGRMGNNLIEFLHSFQYAKDNGMAVAIMQNSWATHLITDMWMAIQDQDINAWRAFVEQAFCVKIIVNKEELEKYEKVIPMETRDLFLYRREGFSELNEYIEFQSNIIRTLYRSYNNGVGADMRNFPVRNMCSVLDAIFGSEKESAVYSVIHSRSMESAGENLLARISRNSGCDKEAALKMEPEYVKAILEPLGMLEHPILFITDHQKPEILEKLLADPDIGPNIHLIPEEASWAGGDITAAVMSTAFIGNPASSFSGFIAKSRVALGYGNNFLLRKKNEDGEWVDVCDHRCIFDKSVMHVLA